MPNFSIPLGTGAAYQGTMDAQVFELAAPDTPVPSNHIRTTQNWGVPRRLGNERCLRALPRR